jgi:hypothetical protein
VGCITNTPGFDFWNGQVFRDIIREPFVGGMPDGLSNANYSRRLTAQVHPPAGIVVASQASW